MASRSVKRRPWIELPCRMKRRFQFADSLTYSTGNHTFKFGADINRVRDIDDNLFTGAGSYTYSNINDFIVDYVNFTSVER